MKRYVLRLGLVMAALLVSVAESRAEAVPVSGEIVGGVAVDEGETTISPGGILITRGLVTEEYLTGDLAGTIHVTITFMVNIYTGEGHMFGTILWYDPDGDGGFSGTWSGLTSFTAPGEGDFDGTWRLSGFGTHKGETALIHNHGPFSGPQVYEGVIVGP